MNSAAHSPRRPGLLGEAGFTLIELLVTMGLLLIVLTTLTDAFISATSAETSAGDRIQVQTDARIALSKMRDDIHCAVAAPSVAINDKGGFSLSLSESPTQCKALGTSSSSPYVEWCTVPNGSAGTYSLYRTIVPPQGGTPVCNTSGATFELTDIVAPSGNWPTNTTQVPTCPGGVCSGNLWPASRNCGNHNFLLTQPVAIAVNSDTKRAPAATYELDDNIALRNSTPCGTVTVTGLLQFAFWPTVKTAGQSVSSTEIPVDVSGMTNPNGIISVTAFGPQASAPTNCTSGGTLVGNVTVSHNGLYTITASPNPWPGGGGLSTGHYYWFATYSGDTNNNTASPTTCSSLMASTTVNAAPVTPTVSITATTSPQPTTLTGVPLTASFTCSGSPCSGATGSVSFYQASGSAPGSTCGGAGWTATNPAAGSISGSSASITASESSAATYYFCASYGGDANFNAANSVPTSGVSVIVPPDTFGFSAISAQTAGSAFNVTITANLAGGGTDTSYSGTKTITFSGPSNSPSPTSKAPSYPASVTFTNGVGTASITLYNAATTSLSATQGAIVTTSPPSFLVNAGTATQFALSTPSAVNAGSTLSNITVTAQDAWNNTASYSGSHTVVWSGSSSSPGGNAPSYPSSATALNFTAGIATASGIVLYNAGNTQLTATESGKSGSTALFVVNVLAGSKLAWTSASVTKGSLAAGCYFTCTWTGGGKKGTFSATVTVTDTYGNPVSNIGTGHSVTYSAGTNTWSSASLALPSSGVPTTASNSWQAPNTTSWSTTLTAASTGYASATVSGSA